MKYSLTSKEVQDKIKRNEVNTFKLKAHKSVKDIILSNVFTLFNTINLILGLLVVFTGAYKNLLFLSIILVNTLIGIYQEVKSKRLLDKLSLLVESKTTVIRDGIEQEISPSEVVKGEYIVIHTGDQIVCDGVIVDGHVEIDESLLTGESDMISKDIDAELFSGSFVTSGHAIMKVNKVGEDNYINELASQAKVYKVYPSKLRDSLNFILKLASFLIVPIGLGLFIKAYFFMHLSLDDTILRVVAALVGMIAEGLILLTSISLAVSSINLAKKRILVQELFCIETLARVDVLCFDKTGTLTTGNMKVVKIIGEDKYKDILGSYVNSFREQNQTAKAIDDYVRTFGRHKLKRKLDFSSVKKYSAVNFENEGTYVLGAFEYIFPNDDISKYPDIEKELKQGKRVVVFAHSDKDIENDEIPEDIELKSIIVLEDEIRDKTKEIFSYFKSQDVDIKIISGDNHISVMEIARRAGLGENIKAIDVSKLTDEELKKAVLEYQVFGRVNPTQKRLMVRALKENGHKVAMSGDGVNDVLALKEADISVAMANGSPATKQIANIVLLDGNFSNFYAILMEGRRVINNIQKVASLFLVKTFYSAAIAILSLFTKSPYPFLPIQLTLISTLTVGLPSFVITFEKSKARVKDNFIEYVFLKSGISAARIVIAVLVINLLGFSRDVTTTMVVILTLVNGILMLRTVLIPFDRYKSILFGLVVASSIISVRYFGKFFAIGELTILQYIISAVLITVIYFVGEYIVKIVGKKFRSREVKK